MAKKQPPVKHNVVNIRAKDDDMAKVLRHPSGVGFREDRTGTWPNDQFTRRRIFDGDVAEEAPPPLEYTPGEPAPVEPVPVEQPVEPPPADPPPPTKRGR